MWEETSLHRVSRLISAQLPAEGKGDDPKGGRGNPKTAAKVRISPALPHGSPPCTLFPFTLSPLFCPFNCLQACAFAGLILLPCLDDGLLLPKIVRRLIILSGRTLCPLIDNMFFGAPAHPYGLMGRQVSAEPRVYNDRMCHCGGHILFSKK